MFFNLTNIVRMRENNCVFVYGTVFCETHFVTYYSFSTLRDVSCRRYLEKIGFRVMFCIIDFFQVKRMRWQLYVPIKDMISPTDTRYRVIYESTFFSASSASISSTTLVAKSATTFRIPVNKVKPPR